jgi:replicative DNA helicase
LFQGASVRLAGFRRRALFAYAWRNGPGCSRIATNMVKKACMKMRKKASEFECFFSLATASFR